jgi:hypothetical protein
LVKVFETVICAGALGAAYFSPMGAQQFGTGKQPGPAQAFAARQAQAAIVRARMRDLTIPILLERPLMSHELVKF